MKKETSHLPEASPIRQYPSCLENSIQDQLYEEELARQDVEDAITEDLYQEALDRQEAEDLINEQIYEEELEKQDEEEAIRDELQEEALIRQEADEQIDEQICEEEFEKQVAEDDLSDSFSHTGPSNPSVNSYRGHLCDDDWNNDRDDYNPWDDYGRSGEKYGWYNGYSDDVIDDAFDGIPEATWNVD